MNRKHMVLSGWGRSSRAEVEAVRPERRSEAIAAISSGGATIVPFGGGRSYGDAALNHQGRVLQTERLERFLEFDPASGVVVCEPGVTYRDLLRVFLPRRFAAPVSPGTAFATLGGAVAADVHGKNHESAGSLGEHILWLDIALPSGEVVRASPEHQSDLFAATIGGMGLTGCIIAIALRLAKVPGGHVRMREHRIADLDAFMVAFEEVRTSATFSVGWIDALARGRALGKGILETAEYAEAGTGGQARDSGIGVPVDLPGLVMNRYSIGLLNHLYFRRVPQAGRERIVPIERFLYPLDAISNWNRMYGRKGFSQFQCVLPDEGAPRGLRAILETVAEAGAASFLAVIKTLGREGCGYLSFPMRGYTLALDFPLRARAYELLVRLERLTLEHGGRVYLAKDSSLSPEGFAAMYPKLPQFREVLERVDPQRQMMSDLARRLRIRL